MGLLDALLGRTQAGAPDLDQLFARARRRAHPRGRRRAAPDRARLGLLPRGRGRRFGAAQRRRRSSCSTPTAARRSSAPVDSYGYTWLLVRARPARTWPAWSPTCTRSTRPLRTPGFGPSLLCSLVGFADADGPAGSGWSTCTSAAPSTRSRPTGASSATTRWSCRSAALLGDDLPVEPDLSRWFPVWGAPGLVSRALRVVASGSTSAGQGRATAPRCRPGRPRSSRAAPTA